MPAHTNSFCLVPQCSICKQQDAAIKKAALAAQQMAYVYPGSYAAEPIGATSPGIMVGLPPSVVPKLKTPEPILSEIFGVPYQLELGSPYHYVKFPNSPVPTLTLPMVSKEMAYLAIESHIKKYLALPTPDVQWVPKTKVKVAGKKYSPVPHNRPPRPLPLDAGGRLGDPK